MVTNSFWIGFHFEEFSSQVAIRKKLISRPEKESKFSQTTQKLTQENLYKKVSIVTLQDHYICDLRSCTWPLKCNNTDKKTPNIKLNL